MIGIGQRIGNYRVRRKLGQGGMGAVYEAVQEQIGRRAAIKVLHPEYANDQQSIQRFFNEARAVNIIQHPGLVGVFESGRLEDGGAYIVMEFLDGELLSGRLEKANRLGQRDVLAFGRQIAAALAAAHAKGIVHRDLKPDNIMIVADPEAVDGERVKIFDFGIAKLRLNSLPPAHSPTGLHTQTGMIMGTPTHMAPEQCRGASDVSGKADVYSLGVILYQMLVGHPPFVADNPGELLSMHLRDKPASLRKLDPSIPEELADLVHCMLAKDPDARPEMLDVVESLEALGAHRTRRHSAPKPSPTARTALGGPGAGPASSSASGDRPRSRPVIPTLQQAVGQTLNGVSSRRFAVAILVSLGLVVISGLWLLDVDLPKVNRDSPPQPAVSADVTWVLESEPAGASIIEADSGQVLGRTPWKYSEQRRTGSLRVYMRHAGYRDTTIVLNYSQPTHQKVPLERLNAPETPEPGANKEPTPAAVSGAVASGIHPASPTGKLQHWQIASRPRGAEVVRVEDNKVLGKTPYKLDQPAQSGILKLLLRMDGYQETSVLLDLSTGTRQIIPLQSLRPRDKEKGEAKPKSESKPKEEGKEKAEEKTETKPKAAPAEKPASPEPAKEPAVSDEIPGS